MRSCWPTILLSTSAAVLLASAMAQLPQSKGQGSDVPNTPLKFEVATVKAVDPQQITTIDVRVYPGGRLVIHAHRLVMLISEAFDIPLWEIVGRDTPVLQDWFDIEGKPPAEVQSSIQQAEYTGQGIEDERVRSMLRSLLIERFQLKFHRESRTGVTYLLERGDGPLRLQPAQPGTLAKPDDTVDASADDMSGMFHFTAGQPMRFHRFSMLQLARNLSKDLRSPVSDRTGLPGFYNFESKTLVTIEDFDKGDLAHLSIESAPEMGLKLVKTTGTVEKFVIDSVQQPTSN